MLQFKSILSSLLLAFSWLAAPVQAGDMKLSFKFVTFDIDTMGHQAQGFEDLSLEAVHSVGVAIFEDGRIATKDYVWVHATDDFVAHGRSVYTFENGDAIVAKFMAKPNDTGFAGTYEVTGGTGAYEGVTGTGEFAFADSAWEDAISWTGAFDLTLP